MKVKSGVYRYMIKKNIFKEFKITNAAYEKNCIYNSLDYQDNQK